MLCKSEIVIVNGYKKRRMLFIESYVYDKCLMVIIKNLIVAMHRNTVLIS